MSPQPVLRLMNLSSRSLTTLACSFILLISAHGQAGLSTGTRLMRSDMKAAITSGDRAAIGLSAQLHDLQYQNGTWYVNAVALVDELLLDEGLLADMDVHINSRMADMYTLRFPLDRLAELTTIPGLRYLSTGTMVSPELQHSRIDTRVDSVNAGLGGLPMGYTGNGVVIAVIDWGFDYTHPVFRDSSFTGLRISKAWDQNKTSGPAPAGFDYGAEYSGMQELLAAREDTLYVFGPGSHGTHVAGIAAGNGAGTASIGMAPDAELVLISLLRTDAGFIDAINYIRDHAESVGKPFVVNMSFGSHLGPHDGTMPREVAMDQMSGFGRVFVGSAGNNGTGVFHLKHTFSGPEDTLRTVVNFGTADGVWGQAVPIWGATGSSFHLSLRTVDNNNALIHETDVYFTGDDPLVNDTVVLTAGDTIFVRIAGEAASPFNGKPNALVEVRRTVSRKLVLQVTAEQGEVHLWNVMRMPNRYTNWGVDLGGNYPGALSGDNQYGMGEPAGVANSVITCASHRAGQFSTGGIPLYGGLSGFTSRGPTVDGRTKPDICAPGQVVRSSVNSFDPAYENAAQTVEFEGLEYPFASFSGTSMSAPAVTGIVALMLQANPWLGAADVKQILRETARLDDHTGEIGPEGDLAWGWGKVDALAAVLAASAVVSTPEISVEPDDVRLYPNPANDMVQVTGLKVRHVRVFSLSGQLVLDHTTANYDGSSVTSFSLSSIPSGAYLVELASDERTVYRRLVRN